MTEEFATKYTGKAFVLSSLFQAQFGRELVTGRTPKLLEPQSPSSDSGIMANQSLVLEKTGKPSITIGWANCATEEAELRTYDYLATVWRKRYPDQGFPVSKHEYADFYVKASHFLKTHGMKLQIADAKEIGSVAPAVQVTQHTGPNPESQHRLAMLLAALLVVLIVAAVALILLW
ncbi:MAG: hypothetical protein KC731_36780 [Myxococcales bacterium]|nr:hypothetical protein [Myxococcales bacterium]